MAGFTDILGAMMKQGMSGANRSRMTNALGAGSFGGGLEDLVGSLSQMIGGSSQAGKSPQAGGGGLGDILGSALGSLGNNKAALGGLGALAGALLGGGSSSAKGAVGGGSLAMLASLAMSALKKTGQAPAQAPRALLEAETPQAKQALEDDAGIIVKAMINAAKADGKIDQKEIDKIIGKLDDDGLTQEEKNFFVTEAKKPMDLERIVGSAAADPEVAAQIYAASLLAIEVDTVAEQDYMKRLAAGLDLHPEVAAHLERTLGL